MPVPKWVAKFNKRVINPREVKRGKWPVLVHVGRSSGTTYHTPLEVHPVDGGYIFVLVYGSDSDWVQNVLAAGSATLEIDGDLVELISPRLVSKEHASKVMAADTKAPPGFLRISEYLQVDVQT
jgi:deazaflavin-dependent oxidoreductase (nitroreductase family)